MALGADRRRIIRMIIGEAMGLTIAGLVVGTISTVAAIRLSSMALSGVSEGDPGDFATATAILAGAALLAGYLPGLRAARVDLLEALRAE